MPSDTNVPIRVGRMPTRTLRLVMGVALSLVIGRLGNAGGQTETNRYSHAGHSNKGGASSTGLVQGSYGNSNGTTSGVGQTLPMGRLLPPGRRLPSGRLLPPGRTLPFA